MNLKNYLLCVLAGLLVSAALLLAALASSVRRPAAATEATLAPRIELEITRTHPNGLDLAWSDPSGRLTGYELFYDVTGEAVKSFGPGTDAGTIDGLTCGVLYRFWLISTDSRDSNTVVGQTGPCQ